MVTVKINENEKYTFNLPEEISPTQLAGFVMKMQKLVKFLNTDIQTNLPKPYTGARKGRPVDKSINELGFPNTLTASCFEDAEMGQKFLDFVKTREGRDEIARVYGTRYTDVKSAVNQAKSGIRKRFQLQ